VCMFWFISFVPFCFVIKSGFPSNVNMDELEKIWKVSADLKPLPMTLIASLLNTEEEVGLQIL